MQAYIAIGSNLGNRKQLVASAVEKINSLPATFVTQMSNWYETEPVGLPDNANLFINGVVEIETAYSPQNLLEKLLDIEYQMGRVRAESNEYQSRTIDLDLLLFGGKIINEPGLSVPHPRMMERMFVLVPLNDLCSGKIIPGTTFSVKTALQQLQDQTNIKRPTL